MARPLRLLISGGTYHVVARGNARQSIFADDGDRCRFLETLETTLVSYAARCHAYCLMSNHYHLLIETGRPNLSRVMRQVNGVYGQRFNRRHERTGHVFQGRFSATLVDRDSYLLEVCRYIVLNPVRAGLVEWPADWRWSSHRAYLGIEAPRPLLCTSSLLAALDPRGGAYARRSYIRFVDEGLPTGLVARIENEPPLLGTKEFARGLEAALAPAAAVDSFPKMQRFVARPSLDTLFRECADRVERTRRIHIAYSRHGFTQREIAQHLGLHPSTISLLLRSGGAAPPAWPSETGGAGRMRRFKT